MKNLIAILTISLGLIGQQPQQVETVTVSALDALPNHRAYSHPRIALAPSENDDEVVVYCVTSEHYSVGEEDLNHFPYTGRLAKDFIKTNPDSPQAQSVKIGEGGQLIWDLQKLNKLLAVERKKENESNLRRLKALDPKKAQLLASFQKVRGLYTASISENGLHIRIDRKTGCFNAGDPESDDKNPVEPTIVRALEKFFGAKIKLQRLDPPPASAGGFLSLRNPKVSFT